MGIKHLKCVRLVFFFCPQMEVNGHLTRNRWLPIFFKIYFLFHRGKY